MQPTARSAPDAERPTGTAPAEWLRSQSENAPASWAILVIAGVSLVVFFVIRLSGDPTYLLLSAEATEADRARFAREEGFDRPLYVQYAEFMKRALRGDLGRSLRYRQPALPLVLERLPATVELAVAALVVSLLVAIPAGVISAVRREERERRCRDVDEIEAAPHRLVCSCIASIGCLIRQNTGFRRHSGTANQRRVGHLWPARIGPVRS